MPNVETKITIINFFTLTMIGLLFILMAFETIKLQVLLGLAFILYFPGYALLLAILPSKKQENKSERLAINFGLSIAIVPLLVYPLNFTPWGIQPCTVIVTLSLFIIAMLFIAFYRRKKMLMQERIAAYTDSPTLSLLDRVFLSALTGAAICTFIALSVLFLSSSKESGVTEFYVLGPDGTPEKCPVTVTQGENLELAVGIGNYEREEFTYTINIEINGNRTMIVGPLVLEAGEHWYRHLQVPILSSRGKRIVELYLKREGKSVIHRRLYFWMDVE